MFIEKFLIHELAERAQTTIRTIRYYTDEGLLPQPELHGKYAYYTPMHLNRLELIRGMKDAYLPLREIRQIMNSLSDEEVKHRLQEKITASQKAEQQPGGDRSIKDSGSSALEYISQLLDTQSRLRPTDMPSVSASVPSVQLDQTSQAAGIRPSQPNLTQENETWRRIPLAPGVELHLREPVDTGKEKRVEQLIAFAKNLFRK